MLESILRYPYIPLDIEGCDETSHALMVASERCAHTLFFTTCEKGRRPHALHPRGYRRPPPGDSAGFEPCARSAAWLQDCCTLRRCRELYQSDSVFRTGYCH